MKENYLFDMTFNNVVFAGRNKTYGAYALRRTYNRHITFAAVLATVLFVAALAWPLLHNRQSEVISHAKPVEKGGGVTILPPDFVLPPPPAQPKAAEQTPVQQTEQKIKAVAYVKPKVVRDSHPDTGPDIPKQSELSGAVISTKTQDGEPASALPGEFAIGESGRTGTGETGGDENAIYEFVADMPYFEGGETGLLRYISKRIKYPRQAVSEQIEGVVVVSFVVNRQGAITDATILRGLGYGTDEEALRVINGMPAWTPGKQNGKPVAVRYTLPIRFSMKR